MTGIAYNSEAGLANHYDLTHDLSGFDLEHPEELEPARRRPDVTISVRFSPSDIAVCARAAFRLERPSRAASVADLMVNPAWRPTRRR